MNIKHCVLAFLAVPSVSVAAVIGYAPGPTGRLELHDDAAICSAPARYATWKPADGPEVKGCWLAAGGHVRVVFLDGDVVTLPMGAILKPAKT